MSSHLHAQNTQEATAPQSSQAGINHDYFYADLSSGSYDENIGVNSNVTALAVGFSADYRENWLLGFDYAARFVHRDVGTQEFTNEYYVMQPAVGYRFPLAEKFELAPRAKIGFKRLNIVEKDSDERIQREDDFIYGFDIKAIYRATKKLELAAIGELVRSESFDENVLVIRGDYHLSKNFSLGAFYTHRDMNDNTTNEGGIALRYYY
ncbi:porin family protein [Vibrio amylolyticus]|nr:porin family protein [Vibrio amylolyticus]